ncbi:MAG: DUF5655 domain-containing protein [Bacteroidota bacterium]
MWECPICKRKFKVTNQSHICTTKTVGELFVDAPDAFVLAYDDIIQEVQQWEPCYVGASTKAVVVTSTIAWLIIRPMKTRLDVKFYTAQPVESERVRQVRPFNNKFGNHIHIRYPEQVDEELFELLRIGFDYSIQT